MHRYQDSIIFGGTSAYLLGFSFLIKKFHTQQTGVLSFGGDIYMLWLGVL